MLRPFVCGLYDSDSSECQKLNALCADDAVKSDMVQGLGACRGPFRDLRVWRARRIDTVEALSVTAGEIVDSS